MDDLEKRLDRIDRRLDKIFKLLNPDFEPKKGMLWRLERLEAAAKARRSWTLIVLTWILKAILAGGLIVFGVWFKD